VIDDPAGEVSHARYHASTTDPQYKVAFNNSWCTSGENDVIRIPKGALPSGGWNNGASWWDGHFSVTQPRNSAGQIMEYDFYQGRSINSGSPGTVAADCGAKTDVENGTGSITATGTATVANFALMAGQVRAIEVTQPPIRHALFMTVPCSNGSHVSWLTTNGAGSICGTDKSNAPPLGQRFYLAYTDAQIAALPAYARPFIQALKDYGMYFGDTGGPADFGLQAALEGSYTYDSLGKTNPWVGWAAANNLPKNSAGRYVLRLNSPSLNVDWTKLRAIQP